MTRTGVSGAKELGALAERLRASQTTLRAELGKGLRRSGELTLPAIRDSARSRLPKAGGLADEVAGSTWAVTQRLSGKSPTVAITGSSRQVRDLKAMNAGRLRHPVFGDRDVWVQQTISAHWFDEPIRSRLPLMRAEMTDAMRRVASKL